MPTSNRAIARYTQPDPLGFIDGPSVYAYVTNSPQVYTDPDGRIIAQILGYLSKYSDKLAKFGQRCLSALSNLGRTPKRQQSRRDENQSPDVGPKVPKAEDYLDHDPLKGTSKELGDNRLSDKDLHNQLRKGKDAAQGAKRPIPRTKTQKFFEALRGLLRPFGGYE